MMPKLAFNVLLTINTQINAQACKVKAINVADIAALVPKSENNCAITMATRDANMYPPKVANRKR